MEEYDDENNSEEKVDDWNLFKHNFITEKSRSSFNVSEFIALALKT